MSRPLLHTHVLFNDYRMQKINNTSTNRLYLIGHKPGTIYNVMKAAEIQNRSNTQYDYHFTM